MLQITRVLFDTGDDHLPIDFKPFRQFIDQVPQSGTNPQEYTITDDQKTILLYATPDAAAAASTLSANVLVTDTSVSVTDLSSFPARNGRIKINDEVMEYDTKNSAGTAVTGVQRGLEGTQVTAHTSGDAVTHRNITVYGVRRILPFEMRAVYSVGLADVTNDSLNLAGTGTTWTNRNVLRGYEFGLTEDVNNDDPEIFYPVNYVSSATALVFQTKYLEATDTDRKYAICSPNPLGTVFDGAIHHYILAGAAIRDGDIKMRDAEMRSFADELGVDEQEVWRVDRPLTVDERSGFDLHNRANVTRGMRVDWT
jgi:hypothetical protein